jgi:hypothetical protein
MSDHDIVVVRTFPTRIEADLARSALEAEGIDAIVRGDDVGGMRPHLLVGSGGAELIVRVEDAGRALLVLDAKSA